MPESGTVTSSVEGARFVLVVVKEHAEHLAALLEVDLTDAVEAEEHLEDWGHRDLAPGPEGSVPGDGVEDLVALLVRLLCRAGWEHDVVRDVEHQEGVNHLEDAPTSVRS